MLPIGIESVTAFAKRHLDGDQPDMPDIANGMLAMQCYQFIGMRSLSFSYPVAGVGGIHFHGVLNTSVSQRS